VDILEACFTTSLLFLLKNYAMDTNLRLNTLKISNHNKLTTPLIKAMSKSSADKTEK